MRSLFVLVIILFVWAISESNGQTILGVRLGGGSGYNAEISYMGPLASGNRLELDLGLSGNDNYSGFQLTGIYQWTFDLSDGFGWYVGPGGSIGVWSYDDNNQGNNDNDDGFWLAVNGQIGFEYNFGFPIQLTLDYRPGIAIINGGGWFNNFGLGIRWRF